MAYCYECGSEVAPNDVFCPYCGISLHPVGAAVPTAGSNAPATDSAENKVQPENHSAAGAGMAASEPDAATEKGEATQEKEANDQNFGAPNDESEVNRAESADADAAPLVGNYQSNQDTEEVYSDRAGEIPSGVFNAQTPVYAAKTDFDDDDSTFSGQQMQGRTERNAEVYPSEAVEVADDQPENISEKTIETSAANAANAFAEPDAADQSNQPEFSNAQVSENLPNPVPPTAEGDITKPSGDLEILSPPPSIFDSVRIMETDQPKKNGEDEDRQFVPESHSEPAAPPKSSSQSGDVQSPTTPNIGVLDTDGKKSAKLRPLDEGTILNGRYEIIRKIGGGGMGAVYLASDNNLGGVLRAVKEMVQSYIEEDQQDKAVNDFKRESMILSTLDHVSIPTIYDYFYDEKESRFYLVMKYINGGDLAARLRSAPEGKIDERTVTEWAMQIADVLDYLHNRPTTIVYRDLKPSNVMIDGNSGRAMLIDFGIARSVNKEEKGVTAVGTIGYAPPELFSGNVEPRSDIYSLGSTMFHLLTGADPQSNPLLIFDFQKNPRPRQINSQLSDQMERILMRAVEYNSQARFESAAEMKKCLADHLDNLKMNKVTFGVKEAPAAISLENQPVFCGFCGQKIMATDMFCAFCGSKQPLSQKGVHSEIYSNSPVMARLMLLGTNELESPVYAVEKDENLIGRRDPMSNIFPEVDLSKFDPQTKISRRHARLWRDGGNFLIEDLGSSNGTTVLSQINNAVRLLPHQPRVLANGDKIRIGDTTLHFIVG